MLAANQLARLAALRLNVGMFVAGAATIVTAIVAHDRNVLLLLAPLLLGLQSLVFQQYAELTVIGAARALLERRIAVALGESALIYETAIAPIRKRAPLVGSVRILQGVSAVAIVAAIVATLAVAVEDQPMSVSIGVSLAVVATLVSALASYRDMLRSSVVAREELSRMPGDGAG